MQTGVEPAQISGKLGTTVETLQSVYGHHHPDFMKDAARVSRRERVAIATETDAARASSKEPTPCAYEMAALRGVSCRDSTCAN